MALNIRDFPSKLPGVIALGLTTAVLAVSLAQTAASPRNSTPLPPSSNSSSSQPNQTPTPQQTQSSSSTSPITPNAVSSQAQPQSQPQAQSQQTQTTAPSSSHSKSTKRRRVQVSVLGLRNVGNTCYMNALLQALSSSRHAVWYLGHVNSLLEKATLASGHPSAVAHSSFSRMLCSAVSQLQPQIEFAPIEQVSILSRWFSGASSNSDVLVNQHHRPLDMTELELRVRSLSRVFAHGLEQQDSDELFLLLLEAVDREMQRVRQVLDPDVRLRFAARALGFGLGGGFGKPLPASKSFLGSNSRGNFPQSLPVPVVVRASSLRWWLADDAFEGAATPRSPQHSLTASLNKRTSSLTSSPIKRKQSKSISTNANARPPSVSYSNFSSTPKRRVRRTFAPIRSPLAGSLLSQLTCERCGRTASLNSSPFSVLSLPMTSTSLVTCLRDFSQSELVEDVDCPRCAALGRSPRQRAYKRLMLGRVPQVLCVRLQRNRYDPSTYRMFKDDRHVRFPFLLDVREICFFDMLKREEEARLVVASATKSSPLNGLSTGAGALPTLTASPKALNLLKVLSGVFPETVVSKELVPTYTSSSFSSQASVTLPRNDLKENLKENSTIVSEDSSTKIVSASVGASISVSSNGSQGSRSGSNSGSTTASSTASTSSSLAEHDESRPPSPGHLAAGFNDDDIAFLALEAAAQAETNLATSNLIMDSAASPTFSPKSLPEKLQQKPIASASASTQMTNSMGTATPKSSTSSERMAGGSSFYRLTAVVEHLGTAFGGHFIAYRRVCLPEVEGKGLEGESENDDGDQSQFWMRASDESVSRVSEEVVAAAQAYMCFYERCDW